MHDPQTTAELFAKTFERILQERMLGLPLLNPHLRVETLGFQQHEGRMIGLLITPWLMNIVMLPGDGDDWSGMELGHKLPREFPGGTYKFMINETDGIGRYQTYSLYSPMREFTSQNHALAAAESALQDLLTPTDAVDEAQVDEELLGRVLRGEETPEIDVDALESVAFGQTADSEAAPRPVRGPSESNVRIEKKEVSRRELLRGLLGDA